MARARNIKPGLFKNELLAEQTIFSRLLFVGLWTLADREGRLEDRPRRIKMELFPCDSDDIEAGLVSLADNGFIVRYEANNVKVIQIANFLKHQTPHGTEKDSELPDQDGSLTTHERDAKGYVTGQKRSNNVNSPSKKVNPPLDTRCTPVSKRPDSLNPDSLNPESNPAPQKTARFVPEDISLPSCVSKVVWAKWIEYRRGRKLPCSKVTVEAQLSNLAKWEASGHSPEEIIMSSIANGWQGLFEPKQNGGNNGRQTRFDKLAQCADELTGRSRGDTRTFDGYATQVD